MEAGTGGVDDNSDSESDLLEQLTVTLLPVTVSIDPNLPANYPVQSLHISTPTSTLTVSISGFNVNFDERALLRFAAELVRSAQSRYGR